MPKLPTGDMGPCEIVWNYGETAALYLGAYLGQVKITGETKAQDIQEERHGDAAVDAILTGTTMSLVIPMTRSTYEALNIVLNAGGIEVSGDHEYLKLKNQVGCDLYDLAKSIVIKPICGDVVSVDPAEWTQIYRAFPLMSLDLTYDRSTQRIFPVTFKIFVSQESGFMGEFGSLGMPSGSTEYGI